MTAITYEAPWPVYALAWSSSLEQSGAAGSGADAKDTQSLPDGARLAIGSFVEEYSNRIQVLGTDSAHRVSVLADALHPYPPTKLGFQPSTMHDERRESSSKSADWGAVGMSTSFSSHSSISSVSSGSSTADLSDTDADSYPDSELLASSADCLRIWSIDRNDEFDINSEYGSMSLRARHAKRREPRTKFALQERSVLAHNKGTASPAPLTSFSWNAPSPNLIVTSSIDTTCTVWDLPTRTALTQLIAHDREVYDVDWCPGSSDVFASVGADGSVRVFDLRSLEHSTIIYETTGTPSTPGSPMQNTPLLRIVFNPWDANYLATFHLESHTVQILDVRAPGSPILELKGHSGAVNSMAWGAPSHNVSRNGPSKGMICTGGDDAQCLVYDLASSTLRSASAQGRRSRNSMRASPANDLRIGAEVPVLAYTAPSMVNNVVWLRSPLSLRRAPQSRPSSFYRSLLQEWTDFTSTSTTQGTGNSDWLALCAGRAVKMLRV